MTALCTKPGMYAVRRRFSTRWQRIEIEWAFPFDHRAHHPDDAWHPIPAESSTGARMELQRRAQHDPAYQNWIEV